MSGSSSRRSRKRSESPCCEYDDPMKEVLEEQIKTLEDSIRNRELDLTVLRNERDQAVESRASKDRYLQSIRGDLRTAKNVFAVRIANWYDLMVRVHEQHPQFSVWHKENWKPRTLGQLQHLLEDTPR